MNLPPSPKSLLLASLALLLAAAAGACSGEDESTEVTIELRSDDCANPSIEVDGDWWVTSDVPPETWVGRKVRAELETQGDGIASLTADDGTVLAYKLQGSFSRLTCSLFPTDG